MMLLFTRSPFSSVGDETYEPHCLLRRVIRETYEFTVDDRRCSGNQNLGEWVDFGRLSTIENAPYEKGRNRLFEA